MASEDGEVQDGGEKRSSTQEEADEETSTKKARTEATAADAADGAEAANDGDGDGEGAQAAAAPKEGARFKAVAALNLGLGLKIGTVYTAGDLRRKCSGSKAKLSSLEEFMKDPKKLALVASPSEKKAQAQASKAAATTAAKADSSRGRGRPATKPKKSASDIGKEGDGAESRPAEVPRPKVFQAGQLIWHDSAESSKLAKVERVATGTGTVYGIRYLSDASLSSGNFASDSDREIIEVAAAEMRSMSPKDLLNHKMKENSLASPLAGPSVAVPIERGAGTFALGEVVWYTGAKRPSWPARVQSLPDTDPARYRVQLFNTRGGSEDTEVLSVSSLELLKLEKDDMPAFYQVAKAVQDAFTKHTSAAATETEPTST